MVLDELLTLLLVATRVMALFLAFPFFNTQLIPNNVKLLLALALSFYLVKILSIQLVWEPFQWSRFLGLFGKELFIGFALGLLANIFIAAFAYAGELVSYFMGFTVVNSFDPSYGQISVLSHFFVMLFYLLFFVTDAHHYFLMGLVASFTTIPLDHLSIHQGIWPYLIEISGELFVAGFKLAFPFALILYLVNLALALVNRLIPQINVFIVGLPLQIFIGLAALGFGVSVLVFMGVQLVDQLGRAYSYLLTHLG
ncbi:MAG: flagellar biosynthetic protein FliR [Nitratiruptor sp.]|nr:flagellar biosynthetic protein FliR [Nitratiruptor sp.]NPA84278.1 flagellar biosynthetic protein FliR [Campylobacterota bacterium]